MPLNKDCQPIPETVPNKVVSGKNQNDILNEREQKKKTYVPPKLTKYGHISKLTTGSSGIKFDGGATKRKCL